MIKTTPLIDPLDRQNKAESIKKTDPTDQNTPPTQGVDPIVLAYFYLMEASNVNAQNALIRAKRLGQNAEAQQQLNDRAQELKWFSVPTLKANKHEQTIAKTHWTWKFWEHDGMFCYVTFQKMAWTTFPNKQLVDNAIQKNQNMNADRSMIVDQLNVLEQDAQTGEASVNSATGQSMQAMQELSNILQILKSLSFKALMRQPPQ